MNTKKPEDEEKRKLAFFVVFTSMFVLILFGLDLVWS